MRFIRRQITWQSNAQGAACAKDEIHTWYIYTKCDRKGTDMKGYGNQL